MTGDEVAWPWGMTDQDPHPSTRPWIFSPKRFLLVVLADTDEANGAGQTLLGDGLGEGAFRIYTGEELLEGRQQFVAQQGPGRRLVEKLTIDSEALDLLVEYAREGRAFMWVRTPEREDANRVIRALSTHRVLFYRYYGTDSVEDIHMT